jgi:hypothetical protein
MDVATLGIKVENGDVVKATASLEGMAVAGTKTEAATQRLTRRMALLEIQAREMDAAMAKSSRTAELLSGAFAGLSAVAAIGFIGRETIKNTIEAQNAIAQLEAAVKSTGGVAGRTVAELDAFSLAMQKTTTYSDEAVKSAQAMLLTFDKIRGMEFDRATQAVADLAARMGGDLQGAAVQVGKALQDPTTGLTALRRSGVSFSESQIAVIRNLYETGRVAEGQRVILKELEHQFGGSAAAARDTFGGALAGLKNAFGDLFEVTRGGSQGTVDAMNAISKSLAESGLSMNTFVTNTVVGWNNITAAVQKAKNWMTVDLSQGLGAAIATVKALNDKVEAERLAANARATATAKAGPAAGGIAAPGSELSQASIDAARKQHYANLDLIRDAEQALVLAGMEGVAQQKQRIEFDATNKAIDAQRRSLDALHPLTGKLLDETLNAIEAEKNLKVAAVERAELLGALKDFASGLDSLFRSGLQSVTAYFEKVYDLFMKLRTRMEKAGKGSGSFFEALGLGSSAIAGGLAGFQVGQSMYSDSHGTTGNYVRGALGGAASGALAGAAIAGPIGPIGAAVGALAGFTGGILGVSSAAKEARKRMEDMQRALAIGMEGLKAAVSGDQLGIAIAQINAEREQKRREYEDAYAGGRNEVERYRLIDEMNRLEDRRIQLLKEEYSIQQSRQFEDLQARLLAAQGHTQEAEAMRLMLAQQREREDLIKSFGIEIDASEASTLALLDQVQAQEKLKKATDAASASALNMVQGYKLQATIFGAITARSPSGALLSSSSVPSGDLHVTVMTPSGEVLGKTVLRDFARRQRLGDAELRTVLQS